MRLDTLVGNMSYASLKALAISSGVCEIYTIVRIGFQNNPNVQVRYRALSSKNTVCDSIEECCLNLGSEAYG